MTTDRLAKLDERIATLRKRLADAERLRETLSNDPELFALLDGSDVQTPAVAGSTQRTTEQRAQTETAQVKGGPVTAAQFQQIAAYLERAGEPRTTAEIVEGTGLSRNATINVLYKTHGPVLEEHPIPGHATKKAWTLKRGWREVLKASGQTPP